MRVLLQLRSIMKGKDRSGNEDYAFENREMMKSFDIFGLNNEKIHTVEVQTPHDLMDIYA